MNNFKSILNRWPWLKRLSQIKKTCILGRVLWGGGRGRARGLGWDGGGGWDVGGDGDREGTGAGMGAGMGAEMGIGAETGPGMGRVQEQGWVGQGRDKVGEKQGVG